MRPTSRRTWRTRAACSSLGAALLLCVTACGGSSESGTAAPDAPSSASAAPTAPTGRTELPASFPRGIVRFPLGFVVTKVDEQARTGITTWAIEGTVDEPVSPVNADLVTAYGEPDSRSGDPSFPNGAPVVLIWTDHQGYGVTFALTQVPDGSTAVNVVVKELA